MNTEQTTAQATKGRDEGGRFTLGNRGGPGNPFARQVATLRKALLDCVTPQDIQDVAGRLIAMAKEGNVQAAKLLLTYTIGKPQPAPEPDRLDADEWEVFRETMPMKKEAAAVMAVGVPEQHLHYVRTMRPVISALMQQQVNDLVSETPNQRKKRESAEREPTTPVELPPDLADLVAARSAYATPPSTNGVHGAPPPSANGKQPPSPEHNGRYEPSTNGHLPPDGR